MSLILSLALFPSIDYMALLLFHPDIKIEAHENYQKQSYRTRYHILGPNGMQVLQVPVRKGGDGSKGIRDMNLLYEGNWPLIHLRALDAAYNKSPWYLFYKDEIFRHFESRQAKLWDFASGSIRLSSALAGIRTEPRFTDAFTPSARESGDFRSLIHPKRTHQDWQAGIENHTYSQVFSEKFGFVPHLSILDLLFNEGPRTRQWLEAHYRLMKETLPLLEG